MLHLLGLLISFARAVCWLDGPFSRKNASYTLVYADREYRAVSLYLIESNLELQVISKACVLQHALDLI